MHPAGVLPAISVPAAAAAVYLLNPDNCIVPPVVETSSVLAIYKPADLLLHAVRGQAAADHNAQSHVDPVAAALATASKAPAAQQCMPLDRYHPSAIAMYAHAPIHPAAPDKPAQQAA